MTEPTLRVLLLLRLLCFMALVYLALHALFAGMISKPDSKVLWFFSVVTAPLTRPVRAWLAPDAPVPRLLLISLLVYGALWVLVIMATQLVAGVSH
jgi:hypothetical protein